MGAGARALTLLVLGMPRVLPSRSFDPIWHPPEFPQIADPGVAGRLAQLLVGGLHDQRMVAKPRRTLAAEKPRQTDLTGRRWEEVDAANDQVNSLTAVVDRHGKLVGPVAEPIANQHVATLARGI